MTDQVLAALKFEEHTTDNVAQEVAAAKFEAHFNFGAASQAIAKAADEIHFSFKSAGLVAAKIYIESHMTWTEIPPPSVPCPVPNTFHPLNIPCIPPPRSRFRKFWSTQPNVCPPTPDECDRDICQSPGLGLMISTDPCWQELSCSRCDGGGALPDCAAPVTGGTLATNDYVRGLIINILGTNAARAASKCGNAPGQRLGYWLDSISGDKSGSTIRYVPTESFSTAQSVQFVQIAAQADMQKLIKYGVANQVTVTASYLGAGTINLKIVVEGVDDQTTVVNSTVTKLANAWVWNS